jgi:hypothetical protein
MPFSVFIPCKYLSADFVISNAKFFHFSRKATKALTEQEVFKNFKFWQAQMGEKLLTGLI